MALRGNNKKKVTLSVDSETYDKFSELCEERGFVLSKQVEFFMNGELSKLKNARDWKKKHPNKL